MSKKTYNQLLDEVQERWLVPYGSEKYVSDENVSEMIHALEHLLADRDTLSMAHDNLHRELQKYKAAYINLSKSVAKLAKANELLVEKNTELAQLVNRTEYKNIRAEVSG